MPKSHTNCSLQRCASSPGHVTHPKAFTAPRSAPQAIPPSSSITPDQPRAPPLLSALFSQSKGTSRNQETRFQPGLSVNERLGNSRKGATTKLHPPGDAVLRHGFWVTLQAQHTPVLWEEERKRRTAVRAMSVRWSAPGPFLAPDLFITCLNWHSLVLERPKFNPATL